MRISVAVVVLFCLVSFTWSEVSTYTYQDDSLLVKYSKENGILTSTYTSYWPNGRKKAEGAMAGNMRYGDWNLWDSTGKLVMARNYETGYVWTQLYPITPWPVTSRTWLRSGKQTDYMYLTIHPDSVLQSVRLWRFLPYDERSPIFANNALVDTLIALSNRGVVEIGEDDEMMRLSTVNDFSVRLNKCNPQHHVVGYRVKEDWFYDAKKQSGISSIIAICPLLMAKNERDTIELGWYNYNDPLKAKLATMYYMPKYPSGFPVGVEQTFFLRCFRSEVYMYSNLNYRTIAELFPDKQARALEIQRMDIQPFEWEHDLWLREFK